MGVKDPGSGKRFPDELYQAPKSWAEKAYPISDLLQQAQQRRSLCSLGTA